MDLIVDGRVVGAWFLFCLFVVACRSLVRIVSITLALSLGAMERCNNVRNAGAVSMAWRILLVCRPWMLVVGYNDHAVPCQHPAYLLSLLWITAPS